MVSVSIKGPGLRVDRGSGRRGQYLCPPGCSPGGDHCRTPLGCATRTSGRRSMPLTGFADPGIARIFSLRYVVQREAGAADRHVPPVRQGGLLDTPRSSRGNMRNHPRKKSVGSFTPVVTPVSGSCSREGSPGKTSHRVPGHRGHLRGRLGQSQTAR